MCSVTDDNEFQEVQPSTSHTAKDQMHPTIHGRCEFCNAVLFTEKLFSIYTGRKLTTPCCGNGKHIGHLPPLPPDLEQLYNHASWPDLARSINHSCAVVTTGVVRPLSIGGKGFHDAAQPPSLLRLQGSVSHWLRPLQSSGLQSALHTVNEVCNFAFLLSLLTALSSFFLCTHMSHCSGYEQMDSSKQR